VPKEFLDQRNLKKKEENETILCWNVYQSHFVYMLGTNLEDSDYIYVVELEGAELSCTKPLKELRIRKPADMMDDTGYDKLGLFNGKYIFAANQT
jgi:hypothetical protein